MFYGNRLVLNRMLSVSGGWERKNLGYPIMLLILVSLSSIGNEYSEDEGL